jgi:putative ABC transport system ATP-binding protein
MNQCITELAPRPFAAPKAPVLELRDIARHYQMGPHVVRALDGVSLSIEEGEYVTIVGSSGSGKSTLLNILGCLDSPSSGQYFLNGQDVARLSQSALAAVRGRRIGFVFQTFELLPRMTALRNVELPLLYRSSPNRRAKALEALRRVGLGERADHRPSEMSGGQRQRVAIARALAQEPTILLADEPTGNLDSKTGQEILALFDQLNHAGQTIVLVTHDPAIAQRSRRVVRLSDGTVLSDSGTGPGPAGVSMSNSGIRKSSAQAMNGVLPSSAN